MKLNQFLRLLNATSDVSVEICDTNLSLDNRSRLTQRQLGRGDYGPYADMKVQSFTAAGGRLIIYVR